jgi:hypothetical protein
VHRGKGGKGVLEIPGWKGCAGFSIHSRCAPPSYFSQLVLAMLLLGFLCSVLALLLPSAVEGHGYLAQPAARNVLANSDYCPQCISAGGEFNWMLVVARGHWPDRSSSTNNGHPLTTHQSHLELQGLPRCMAQPLFPMERTACVATRRPVRFGTRRAALCGLDDQQLCCVKGLWST